MTIFAEEDRYKDPNKPLLEVIGFCEFVENFLYMFDFYTGTYGPVRLWPEQRKLAHMLETERKFFWAKARQVGGSALAGMYCAYVAITEPKSNITVVSISEPEAIVFFRERVLPVLDNLPRVEGLNWPKYTTTSMSAKFDNGSIIECLTTNDNSGRGRTNRLSIIDEAGAIDRMDRVWRSQKGTIEKHPKGQIIVISNSSPGSWFNQFYRKLMDGKVKGIARYFLSAWADPARDQKWYQEEITQYVSETDFYLEYPLTEDHLFLQKDGLVYPTFNPKEGGEHVAHFEPNWMQYYMYGYDDGFVHYAVFLQVLYDAVADHIWVLDELYLTGKDTSQVGTSINEKVKFWLDRGAPTTPWKKIADTAIFAQKGQKTVAEILRSVTGISFSKSLKFDEEGSTQTLRMRFTKNQITIHPRCFNLIRQLKDARYDDKGKARDADNDGIDVLRYLCAEVRRQDAEKPKQSQLPFFSQLGPQVNERIFGDQNIEPYESEWNLESWLAY